jgi:hypothetical protein
MDAHLERVEVQTSSARDDDLSVEAAAPRQLPAERLLKLREISVQRLLVSTLEDDFVTVAKYEHPKAVPLGLVDPSVAIGQGVDPLGEHREDGRTDRELHAVPQDWKRGSVAAAASARSMQIGASFSGELTSGLTG